MALIKCSECGQEISDKAVACPNCGNPNNLLQNEIKQETIRKKVINKKFVIIGISVLLVIIAVISIVIYNKNKKTPIEKIVDNDFQTLKKEVGDNILIKDALYFKRTRESGDNVGEEWHQVLIVYEQNGVTKYAGFASDGEYLGNGDEYVNAINPDMDVAWNNYIVSLMKIEYEQYEGGAKRVLYTTDDFEDVVEEKDSSEYEHCVIPVSLEKIR